MSTKSKQPIYLILLACLLVSQVMTCQSEKSDADLPVVTTGEIYGITSHWTNASGTVTDDGGSEITARGFCWSANANPTLNDEKCIVGKGMGEFHDSFKGLIGNTTYHVCAYATNSAGTVYGEERTFTTPPTVTDVDGYEYATVVIGEQTWLAENLRVKHFRNGDPVTYIPSGQSFPTDQTPVYWDYDAYGETGLTYGLFYNWFAVADDRGLPPAGWHVPSLEEFITLVDFLGGASNAGYQLRETGTLFWNDCDAQIEATNSSGFTALGVEPGGNDRKWEAFFVTLTETFNGNINCLGIDCSNEIWWVNTMKPGAFSIRCIKDE